MHITPVLISLFVCTGVCLLSVIGYFLVKKENRLLTAQLTEMRIRLATDKKKFRELQSRYNNITTFHKSIEEAELTTRFQAPRLNASREDAGHQGASKVPEKYSYVRSLTEKGMSVEEIASVLSISSHEASQLVTLTKMAA